MPDRKPIAIGPGKLPTAAMLYDQERKPFFIVPLPSLFHKLAGPEHAHSLKDPDHNSTDSTEIEALITRNAYQKA